MIELSKRLAAVARQIPKYGVVADIGTDHAYLPVFLIQNGTADKVLAGDITEGPCRAAMETVQAYKLEKYITVRRGDGLKVLEPGEADLAVIAGMGGKTICHILSGSRDVLSKLKRLVLQPMRDVSSVRGWLTENGWCIVDEDMIYEEGHYYVIISAEKGEETICDEFTLEIGPRILEKKNRTLLEFLKKRHADLDTLIKKLERAKSDDARQRLVELSKQKERIREVIEEW